MDSVIPSPRVEELVLDRLKIAATQTVSPYILREMEMHVLEDFLTQSVMLRFQSEVLAKTLSVEKHTETVTWQTPASPWQFFKERHADSWWLRRLVRRRPVRFDYHSRDVTVTAKQLAVFPDAEVTFPKSLGNPRIVNIVQGDYS